MLEFSYLWSYRTRLKKTKLFVPLLELSKADVRNWATLVCVIGSWVSLLRTLAESQKSSYEIRKIKSTPNFCGRNIFRIQLSLHSYPFWTPGPKTLSAILDLPLGVRNRDTLPYDLLFLFNIHRTRIHCPDLLAAFGLCVPRRPTRTLTLWHVPFARVNTVLRSPLTRVPSLCNTFLNCDNSVDIFTSTVYSYKSSVIGFTRTLDAY